MAKYFDVHDLSEIVAAKFAVVCKECDCDLQALYDVVDEVYGEGYSSFVANFLAAHTDDDDQVGSKDANDHSSSTLGKLDYDDETEDVERFYDQAQAFLAEETGIASGMSCDPPAPQC